MGKILSTLFMALMIWAAVPASGAERTEFKAVIDNDGIQRVEIVGGDYFFKPDYIIVKANIPVELIVRKDTFIVPHSIVINAPEAGIDFNESLSRTAQSIKFIPTKPGKYPMYCDKKPPFFKSHRDRGMEGVLEVIE